MRIMGIIEIVARHYGVGASDILGSSRDDKVVAARRVAIYLARQGTESSLLDIARAFGKTHATVIHAEKTVFRRMGGDAAFRAEIEQLRHELELAERQKAAKSASSANDEPWLRIQAFLQEAGIVLDYLHWRVLCKR